jgi:mono/diheme cytochrome c family protein
MRPPAHAPALVALALSCAACGGADPSGETGAGSTGTTNPAPTTGSDTTAAPTTGDPPGTTSSTGDAESSTGAPLPPPGPWDQGWPIPETPQVPGDPVAGREALLSAGYVTCGVPYVLFPLAKPFLGDFAAGEPLPGRTGKNAEVPYNWTVHTPKSGVEIASFNCLECHAGRFNGELVVGLGVTEADFTSVPMGDLVDNLPILDIFPGALGEIEKFAGRYKAVGPHIKMLTVGTNPADMLAAQLAAHHDVDTLAWSDAPLVDIPDVMAPVDPPPWWRAAKKHGLFYNGMNRGDHRGTMMFASSLCTDTVAEATEVLSYFNDINAYLESLRAPEYPFAIDEALAAAGAPVFAAHCAGCHGTYAEDDADETYPNLLLPLAVIGTDPALAAGAAAELRPMVDWFNASYFGTILQLIVDVPFPGYVAPPLDGVWATAPYLHNGSVPTLAAVLDSASRPTYWKRKDFDSTHYDQSTLGWPFLATQYGQDGAPVSERKYIYDTSKPGHGNGGHTFGDALTAAERKAVLEYIKTL